MFQHHQVAFKILFHGCQPFLCQEPHLHNIDVLLLSEECRPPPASPQASQPTYIHTVFSLTITALSENLQFQIGTSDGSHYNIFIQVLLYAYVYSYRKSLHNRTLFPNVTLIQDRHIWL